MHNTVRNLSFKEKKDKKKYWVLISIFSVLSIFFTLGLILYNNPVPMNSSSFYPIIKKRITSILAMLVASICHSLSTISFQSITNNKIITPSLLGFEAIYTTIQTSLLYFFGLQTFIDINKNFLFIFQIVLMLIFCTIIYGLILSKKKFDMQLLLLVGIVLGAGLRSFSTFLRRLMSPNEFDILQARLFASVNNADSESIPISLIIVLVTSFFLFKKNSKLNVLSLGRDISINLGLDYKKNMIEVLILVTILMSVSTALIGPLTFLGFLVAMLTYQICPTYDHKYMFLMSVLLSFLVLTSSYFLMNHIFNAQGVVSIIIELFGGISFLYILLRKGHL